MIKVNEQARKAMGILMGLFHPDCNAHRSLTTWYAEILPGLIPLQARRKDFNFRNAFEKWLGEFKPNKQYNLDTILLASPSLLVREEETSLMAKQILLKARVRRIRKILGRKKFLIMVLLMEFRLLFLLFLRSYNR